MPVRIGQLDVIAAPPPARPDDPGARPAPAPTGLDLVKIHDAEQRRRRRRSAD